MWLARCTVGTVKLQWGIKRLAMYELESRPLEWRLAGTGLCSYRVRGVDGIFQSI